MSNSGFGSAGQRHAQNASTLGFDVIVILRKTVPYPRYPRVLSKGETSGGYSQRPQLSTY